ncbi:CHAT domain-containing protein [Micromonospora purpureochromogenes]|uniref:CHAT domain-containing protein n=1 Tax=Micromonospora purpureochromogenes TaxID=47872 RepID=A0A1C4WPP4_9ACTN|nr:CHAT domain-containing protein [Micromonospora purpureochromogenes]SCE98256.1 CHAT domain-containing protein [Micromonospora purpureochromogenes]
MGLLLEAVDVLDRWRWRWLLTDEATGAVLADHTVVLRPDSVEVEAFDDLYRHLRWNAELDRRVASEAELVEQLGAWIGRVVLGEAIGRAIVDASPVTVRVVVPDRLGFLAVRPLELAHVDGVALARRGDVSLVFDIGPGSAGKAPVGGRLRMLAVFSLPSQTTALALRRERYGLTRLVRTLAARRGRAVELEVLQYGVTRQVLAQRMTAAGGPDVLHLSGHGGAGVIALEHRDGSEDQVNTEELLGLLRPGRGRVKLAVMSACQSAAATTAETLRWLRLDEAAEAAQEQADAESTAIAGLRPVMGVARQVAQQLGCAVIAMRYPVVDDFAVALADELYRGLFEWDLPVDAAVRRAVPAAAGEQASLARPAVSIATPVLLGASAAGMLLTPPAGPVVADPARTLMAGFPSEPVRFVGRVGAMARGSGALAPDGGRSAVLFHGMAGAGKTACALELAYRHQNAFSGLAFWKAPERSDEFPTALTSLAWSLEAQLEHLDFTMLDAVAAPEAFDRFLPRLTEVLEQTGLLLVFDNLETLLTEAGGWRDPRWGRLVAAMSAHDGLSRVVLTSRIVPNGLDTRVLVEPVHALSRDETVLLARELPHLRALLHADPSPTRQPDTVIAADRDQVRAVLNLVQGHPKLLELADAAAADPQALARHLHTTGTSDAGLTAFFTAGYSSLDPDGFLATLAQWTATTLDLLPEPARLAAQLLCGVEDDDRWSFVAEGNWADLWRALNRPDPAPEWHAALTPLVDAALMEVDRDRVGQGSDEDTPSRSRDRTVRYRIHPGVAETIRIATPADIRTAIDTELAAFWNTLAGQALHADRGENSALVIRAGLSATPYLIRLKEWDLAASLLEQAIYRDESPGTRLAAIAHLRRITEAVADPSHIAILAGAVAEIDRGEGERLLRAALNEAETSGDHALASSVAGDLVNLLKGTGRSSEALAAIDDMAEHTRRAGLGRWTQLADEGWRAQITYKMGKLEQALGDVQRLRTAMQHLPDERASNDTVEPFNVRETILNLGVVAAGELGRHQDALDLNAEVVASQRGRGAGLYEITNSRFNDYASLIGLGRLDQAEDLLLSCQQIFEGHNDVGGLQKVLAARGNLAYRQRLYERSVVLQQAALRYGYLRPDPHEIAAGHHNLAVALAATDGEPAQQLAHFLASAVLSHVIGETHRLANAVVELAKYMHHPGNPTLPTTVAQLAHRIDQTKGARFSELIAALAPDPHAADHALTAVLEAARAVSADQVFDIIEYHLDRWEPVLATLVAAVTGDQKAAAALTRHLDQAAGITDWADVAAALRRILAGERDPDQLLTDLDPVDTAITQRALDALTAAVQESPTHD